MTSLTSHEDVVDDTWQLQKAKAEFSKLIDQSIKKGPQVVTRHGRPAAVVMSAETYADGSAPAGFQSVSPPRTA